MYTFRNVRSGVIRLATDAPCYFQVDLQIEAKFGRMLIQQPHVKLYMESGSAFDSAKFMHLTALSEGVDIVIGDSTLTNWKDNVDVVLDMFDLGNSGTTFSKATRSLSGRFSMWKLSKNGCSLAAGQVFKAVVNDDLSTAGIILRIKLQGELRPN